MRKTTKEISFLIIFFFLFVFLRSINYIYFVNWSGDQAAWGIEALRIWRTKSLTLIGPQISANLQGRFIFQGPIIYYMILFFLLLAKWHPIIASYLFMIFAGLMIFPLYFGMKKLVDKKAAWLMIIIYSLVPYYLNYTRFLWNSTFQLSLLPILIWFVGTFKQKKGSKIFLLSAVWLGLLLQFHYQFILVIFGFFIYYFVIRRLRFKFLLLFTAGCALGFSPIILFELKHQLYNLKTLLLYFTNWKQLDRPGGFSTPHYYLSLSFMLIFGTITYLAKYLKKLPAVFFGLLTIILAVYNLSLYLPYPSHAFWAPADPWNYQAEERIYEIIRSTGITKDFNIANLAYYDTKSVVVKYFMKRDGYLINYDDYYNNKYLFVVSEGNHYLVNPAYEVATFKPSKIIKKWKINGRFTMLLLERIPKQ